MTGIQWTTRVWNPSTGCDKVSPGCGLPRFDGDDTGGCYAMAMAKRLKAMGQAKYQNDGDPRTSGPGFGVAIHPDTLSLPLTWRKPARIFVNSMSDLFHDQVPDEFIARAFVVMALAPQHTFQLLTKRHARMRSLLSSPVRWRELLYAAASDLVFQFDPAAVPVPSERFRETRQWIYGTGDWTVPVAPLPNVHLGVSAEDQHWADIRIPALLATPAAVRWVSAEPLLGPIDLRPGQWLPPAGGGPRVSLGQPWASPGPVLSWIVAGGESGPGARRCELGWLRSMREQCAETGTPYFCKQLGSVLGRELDAGAKGGDISRFPEDLRVREYPRTPEQAAA